MNFKTTIVLLILLVLVGVYLGVQHFTGGDKTDTTSTDNAKLITAKSEDITGVTVTGADGKRMVLVKNGKDWRLTEPTSAKAETFAVEDLLRQLTSLQARGQLKPDQKASVGLDAPKFVVELTASGKTTKLSVGDENKIGDSLYVLLDDQKNPQIVGTAVYDQLNKPASDYRSKKLTDLSFEQGNEIRELSITQNGKTVRLEKQGMDWRIVEPRAMPADSTAVSSLVSAITELNATDFVASPSTSASDGLQNPTLLVTYSMTPPATSPASGAKTAPAGHQVAFGRYATIERNEVYVSVDGGPVATVSTTSEDAFKKTALDFRDKKVADIDPAHVTSFTLAVNRPATTQPTTQPAQQYEYTIARRKESTTFGPLPAPPAATQPASTQASTTQPGSPATQTASSQPATQPASKWVIESGGSGNANDAEVEALLSALHPLNATKFVEASAATQPSPQYTLTMHVGPANGKGPQDLVFRFASPGPTGDARGTCEDLAFDTDRSILEKLDAKFGK